jgi:hypothetical protein
MKTFPKLPERCWGDGIDGCCRSGSKGEQRGAPLSSRMKGGSRRWEIAEKPKYRAEGRRPRALWRKGKHDDRPDTGEGGKEFVLTEDSDKFSDCDWRKG